MQLDVFKHNIDTLVLGSFVVEKQDQEIDINLDYEIQPGLD